MAQSKPVIVALDVPTLAEAKKLVADLSGTIQYFKVGKELFTACGPEVVKAIHDKKGQVFLDLKFHDIPNTAAAAVKAACSLGVFMLNVHAFGGKKMMEAAVQALPKTGTKPHLIAVTVLTSMDEQDLQQIGVNQKPHQQVLYLAKLAKDSGMAGVVCSGEELASLRGTFPQDFLLVVPGIRPEGSDKGDQKRVMTPQMAFAAGASYIVIGRPITQADKPREAAETILKHLDKSR